MRPRATIGKRTREKDRVERNQLKMEKRATRKADRKDRAEMSSDEEDPDIAGIVPGPQKLDPDLFGLRTPDEPISGE